MGRVNSSGSFGPSSLLLDSEPTAGSEFSKRELGPNDPLELTLWYPEFNSVKKKYQGSEEKKIFRGGGQSLSGASACPQDTLQVVCASGEGLAGLQAYCGRPAPHRASCTFDGSV